MVAQIDREYLGLGVGRSTRRLVSYACFEGRPATTRGQWINPAVFGLLRSLASLPGRPQVDRPVFITGLGRSGTTILGMLLSVHADVGFLNEPKALWHVIDPRQDVNGNYGGHEPLFRMTAAHADNGARERAHRLVARYLASVRASRLVDKYPELIFRVDYVRALFPDARFVFIHRDGVDACQSIVKWSERLGRASGGSLEDWWGRNDSKWHNLWRELVAGDPEYADIARLEQDGLDHANRAALEWVLTMREGLRQVARHAGVVIRLRYEDLVQDPDRTLQALLQACDLRPDADLLRYARGRLYENQGKSPLNLLPAVQRWFEMTMADLGYSR